MPDAFALLVVGIPYAIGARIFYQSVSGQGQKPRLWISLIAFVGAYLLMGPIASAVFEHPDWGIYEFLALALLSAEQGYLITEKLPAFFPVASARPADDARDDRDAGRDPVQPGA